jgi:hypothetical protein
MLNGPASLTPRIPSNSSDLSPTNRRRYVKGHDSFQKVVELKANCQRLIRVRILGNSVEEGEGRSCPRWHPTICRLVIPIREARGQPLAAGHSPNWVVASIVECYQWQFECMDDGIALNEPTARTGLPGYRGFRFDHRSGPSVSHACAWPRRTGPGIHLGNGESVPEALRAP